MPEARLLRVPSVRRARRADWQQLIRFCVAWTSNFVFNKFWTFQRHGLSAMQQGARYLAVSLVALGINLIVLELLVRAGMPEVPAQAIAIAVVMPVNFLLNRRWSFR